MRMSIKTLEDKLDAVMNKLIQASGAEACQPGSDDHAEQELQVQKKTVAELQVRAAQLEIEIARKDSEAVESGSKLRDAEQQLLDQGQRLEAALSKIDALERSVENLSVRNKSLEEAVSAARTEASHRGSDAEPDELMKKTVRKIVNKAFKSIRSELGDGNEDLLKRLAFHIRSATEQLLDNS
jgi:chromosome segregation ATPase